jgi:beta-galactosidase
VAPIDLRLRHHARLWNGQAKLSDSAWRMNRVSRRDLLRAGALGGASLTLTPAAARAATTKKATASSGATYDFNQGWRFGGVYGDGSQEPGYPDHRYPLITLPHTVTPLSWGDWNPATWERTWIYRKHFSGAALTGGRVFVDFDGVMTDATVYLNGVEMAQHQGGFLPWSVELTDELSGAGFRCRRREIRGAPATSTTWCRPASTAT